jgi:hypothetical protein
VQKISDCHANVQDVEQKKRFAALSCSAGQLCGRNKAQKKRPARGALLVSIKALVGLRKSVADGGAGNATNVVAADAEVVQFAVRHAAEFGYGLTILAPVGERASDVHGEFLF